MTQNHFCCFPIKLPRWGDFLSRELYKEHLQADHSCPGVESYPLTWPCGAHSAFPLLLKLGLKNKGKVSMVLCLSIKSKADNGISSYTTESHKRGHYRALCVGVRVCEAVTMCVPANNASIHPPTQLSPCWALTHPWRKWNTFINVETNLVL